jgi:hypothetical protein
MEDTSTDFLFRTEFKEAVIQSYLHILSILTFLFLCFSPGYSQENATEYLDREFSEGYRPGDIEGTVPEMHDLIPLIQPLARGFHQKNNSGAIEAVVNSLEHRRKIGIGLMIGEPIGINLKFWSRRSCDVEVMLKYLSDFLRFWPQSESGWMPLKRSWVLAAAYPIFPDGFLHVHLDHLWHNYNLGPTEIGWLPFYYGTGARARFGDGDIFGIRGVLGVGLLFFDLPAEAFVELAPIVDFFPDWGMDFNMVVGMRFYFDN